MTAGEIEALYGTGYTESGVIRSYPLGQGRDAGFHHGGRQGGAHRIRGRNNKRDRRTCPAVSFCSLKSGEGRAC